MDESLLHQYKEFRHRNIKNATKVNIPADLNIFASTSSTSKIEKKKLKRKAHPTLSQLKDGLKHLKSQSCYSFDDATSSSTASSSALSQLSSMMVKIEDYMKNRYLEDKTWPLSLNECLAEIKQTISKQNEQSLMEKLLQSQKLSFSDNGKFCFKPIYKLKTDEQIKSTLLKHYRNGKGGMLLSDLNQCMLNADERMAKLESRCITVPCQYKKKKDKSYFYNDPNIGITVDKEFLQIWRLISVENIDEKKIEEYLAERGLTVIKDQPQKRINRSPIKQDKKSKATRRPGKIQNIHVDDILEIYKTD